MAGGWRFRSRWSTATRCDNSDPVRCRYRHDRVQVTAVCRSAGRASAGSSWCQASSIALSPSSVFLRLRALRPVIRQLWHLATSQSCGASVRRTGIASHYPNCRSRVGSTHRRLRDDASPPGRAKLRPTILSTGLDRSRSNRRQISLGAVSGATGSCLPTSSPSARCAKMPGPHPKYDGATGAEPKCGYRKPSPSNVRRAS